MEGYIIPASSTAFLMATAPSCGPLIEARVPRNDPTGVLTALTINTSCN